MSQSLLYALIFFALGFVTGLLVAALRAELRLNKTADAGETPKLSPIPVEPQTPSPIAPATVPTELPSAPLPHPSQELLLASPPVEVPVKPVSLNPLNSLLRGVPGATLKEKPKSKSMAVEIDEILQEKLALSPLAGRAIRLQEQPDHTLAVLVDGVSFDGVNQVSEPAVRLLIQDAVTEWQRRATLGSNSPGGI